MVSLSSPTSVAPVTGEDRFKISNDESRQIDIARFVCIFFMVGVHVYPGTREPSLLYQGELHLFWVAYVDLMGRASVATLSFLGGYILYAQSTRKSPGYIFRERAVTVYLPMVTWNVIKVAILAIVVFASGADWSVLLDRLKVETLMDGLNLFFGLTDRSANVPLGFLRDLFVAMVIARLIMPIFVRAGPLILAIVFVLAAFRATEPIMLRPSILVFVLFGVMAAYKGWTVTRLSHWKVLLIGGSFFGLLLLIASFVPISNPDLDAELPNLLKRLMLVPVVLWISRFLVITFEFRNMLLIRPWVLLTYLSHGVVGQILAAGWIASGISNHSPIYMVFFFACTIVFFAVGYGLAKIVPYLPEVVQKMLNGVVRPKN
ncbi:MAG: hypothetical protein ACI9TA_002457 [Reinekea sp.]|jgi:hypothetical protein